MRIFNRPARYATRKAPCAGRERERGRSRLFCRFRRAGCKRFVQTRFPALRSILMNDPAFGGFIDRRNQGADVVHIPRFTAGSSAFCKTTQVCEHATIAEGADAGLAGAFGGGFGVGHKNGSGGEAARTLAEPDQEVKIPSSPSAGRNLRTAGEPCRQTGGRAIL